MLNSLLAIIPNADGNFYFDSFGEALVYALIGFMVVFLGIVLIIFIIWLIGLILRKTNNLEFITKIKRFLIKKIKEKREIQAPVKVIDAQEDNGEVPDEVKAAIVAAIMAYYSEEKPKCEFRGKRIKKL